MPKGPKGEKRPADVIGNAVHVMRIATGEREEAYAHTPEKNAAAVEAGKIGGLKRAEGMTPERRSEIARQGFVTATDDAVAAGGKVGACSTSPTIVITSRPRSSAMRSGSTLGSR
jgi:hypothetical protein